jgi:hypothetical protein
VSVAGLAYVALAVRDVDATAKTLEQQFELGRREAQLPDGRSVPLLGIGDSALALFAADDPFLGGEATTGVHHIAIAAADPANLVESIGIAPGEFDTAPGLDGRPELRLDADATCGVRTRLCPPLDPAPAGGDRIQRIDHVGVASTDNGAATELFAARLGLAVESTQTDLEVHTATESFTSDRYGVVYHNRAPRIVGGLRVSFITVGDCELEFLQPYAPQGGDDGDVALGAGPGSTRGDKGAIGRYIERYGPGLHHLALKTADIDAALTAFSVQGLSLIDSRGRPGSRRARIGFIHPRSLSGVLVHLVERDEL